jgi:hypothetical protein
MIPRTLVPDGARLPAEIVATTRRRSTSMDERTLVPSEMPLVKLDGRSTIPTNLPLESIAARMVVPRDLNVEMVQRPEDSHLPPQPTEMDERITIPVGVAPPEVFTPLPPISEDLVEPDIFQSGEAAFLPPEWRGKATPEDRVTTVASVIFHIALVILLIFSPKIFKPHVLTGEEQDIARRQMTVLLPPGALESLRPTPAPAPHESVRVDPRVINKVAPRIEPPPVPVPQPTPEQPKRDLPSAPTPRPDVAVQQPPPNPAQTRGDLPKTPVRLENPDMPVPEKGLILPKSGSPGDMIRDATKGLKPNAPIAMGGGGPVPSGGGGHSGRGTANAGIEMLTDTEGVDFNDYLRRVYIAVRNNWYSVMPPSVSLGDQGVVSLQFKIMRDGGVPDGMPVQVFGSGKEPLDRAAFSSIRASNPFPPLPSQFKGPYIELRFTYYYNIQPPNQ